MSERLGTSLPDDPLVRSLGQQHERDATRCSTCSVSDLCIALGSDATTLARLDDLLRVKDLIGIEDSVVHQGDPFKGLFAVRRGCFKSFVYDREGNEQVQGFHFSGELIGLEAVSRNTYVANVVALEPGSVCHLRYGELLEISSCSNALQKQLFRLFSSRIAATNWRTGDFSADECVAAFLLDMSVRLKARNCDATDLILQMSRRDIGSYLGFAVETVSRTFSRLRDRGLITVRRKRVVINDLKGLRAVAARIIEKT